MNRERLLNVAKALRESPNPGAFSMEFINVTYAGCRTPACAIGHYAHRKDLQDAFALREGEGGFYEAHSSDSYALRYDGPQVRAHFDITEGQARQLFRDSNLDEDGEGDLCGCGGAETAIEAAEYIERFVAAFSDEK